MNRHQEFRESLKRLQANDPTLQQLCFLYLCPISASLMGRALTTNTHLRVLLLDKLDGLDERSAADLADGIRYSKIEELGVCSKVFVDQPVLWRQVCQGVQASSTIRQLLLMFKNESVIPTSMDWLGSILSSLTNLEKLTLELFRGIIIDQVLFNILSKSSSLTTLSLRTDPPDDVDVNRLVQILRQSSSLKRLELEGCNINNNNLQLLVDCWHPNLSIRSLCLDFTTFDSSGLQILLRAIADGHMLLHELDLPPNFRLGYDGLRILGEALPSLTTITM
jgi:hypothetical protein